MAIDVTDSNFQKEVIEKSNKTPVLVDFWASWCGPCVMLKPILEEVSNEYKGKVIIAKMNVEDNQTIAEEYGIMSIPAVKLFKDGEVIDEFVGLRSKQDIKKFIDSNL